jgi:flagellar motor protein MotB
VEKGQVSTLRAPLAEQLDDQVKTLAPISNKMGHNAELAPPVEGTMPQKNAKEGLMKFKQIKEVDLLEQRKKAEDVLAGQGTVKITPTDRGWVVELAGDEIFFDKDSDQLTDQAKLALYALAPSLGLASEIAVEGFSSDSPKGGFGLSTRRSLGVLEILQSGCVPDEKMSATGFGVRAPGSLGGRDYVRIALRR